MTYYRNSHFDRFEAGDIIAIRFGVGLSHYGVVTSRGTVISNSRRHGGVIEQSLSEFSDGKRVRLCRSTDTLGAMVAERRVRRVKGTSYNLTASNCTHLARWAHREKPTSVQIASATLRAFGDMFFGPNRQRY